MVASPLLLLLTASLGCAGGSDTSAAGSGELTAPPVDAVDAKADPVCPPIHHWCPPREQPDGSCAPGYCLWGGAMCLFGPPCDSADAAE